jgi:hypothetical protein
MNAPSEDIKRHFSCWGIGTCVYNQFVYWKGPTTPKICTTIFDTMVDPLTLV